MFNYSVDYLNPKTQLVSQRERERRRESQSWSWALSQSVSRDV